MGRKPLPILYDVEIIDIAAEGNALARVDNRVVFVPKLIPGDIVDIQVVKKRSNYWLGRVLEFKRLSPLRTEPVCEHFGICGGCKWQHLPYSYQLQYKQKQVIDTLERIGHIEIHAINPIIPSDDVYYYRNKLEFTFSNNRWLPKELIQGDAFIQEPGVGFHIEGLFDKVLDLNLCHLQPEPSNQLRLALKQYLIDHQIPFYDLRKKEGLVRNLIVRNTNRQQWMAIIIFGRDDEQARKHIFDDLKHKFPEIHSWVYAINTKLNDSVNDLDFHVYDGMPYIYEEMEGIQFRIGPKSFFQTNSKQAYKLYAAVREMAEIDQKAVVYDLYTGTGTIALFVARNAAKVIGIEYIDEAIHDARENARINHINNAIFYSGDVKEILNDAFIKKHGKPDILITDPPRNGMHESVVKTILKVEPRRIVYVSCNPATQARDLQILSEKYMVEKVQPVDMFPHTHHVENIALLVKKTKN